MNDLLLLATLLPGPSHGYALKKRIALTTGHPEMHNNLVYPLLKRFVRKGWVSRRQTAGQRGQTRELYSLTAKGRQELLQRLAEFPPKAAASPEAFSLRVGLFSVVDAPTRKRILDEREKWLTERATRLATLSAAMPLGHWGGAVVKFREAQVLAEQKWLLKLRGKAQKV